MFEVLFNVFLALPFSFLLHKKVSNTKNIREQY